MKTKPTPPPSFTEQDFRDGILHVTCLAVDAGIPTASLVASLEILKGSLIHHICQKGANAIFAAGETKSHAIA